MFALLILPILISGFIHLSQYPKEKLKLHRYDGQLLYLKSAKHGVVYLLITSLLCFLLKDFAIASHSFQPVTWLIDIIKSRDLNKEKISTSEVQFAWLLVISFLTIIFSYFCTYLAQLYTFSLDALSEKYYGNKVQSISYLGDILKDSPIDSLFYNSFSNLKPILITLKSKKVYVGIVNQLGEPNESSLPNQEISIVPALSGYRSSDKLKVIFTNDYDELDSNENDISTIIKVCEIETTSWFNAEVYERVNGNVDNAQAKSKGSNVN
ncbi:hypothetical protein KZZ04_00315 [Pseudoalteromonas sp. CR1]|uniref:hypothetical protein n=1 Tax=Pseudoalteromonas sp. CR1 TaxID=2861964 RepID=UPI001C5D6B2E|nr:hypothetical protein [Pseudoalteromonas sp. CR1]MBW4964809.1 hypothetical protein [Pseudoalteromonas sp. CR1]